MQVMHGGRGSGWKLKHEKTSTMFSLGAMICILLVRFHYRVTVSMGVPMTNLSKITVSYRRSGWVGGSNSKITGNYSYPTWCLTRDPSMY